MQQKRMMYEYMETAQLLDLRKRLLILITESPVFADVKAAKKQLVSVKRVLMIRTDNPIYK